MPIAPPIFVRGDDLYVFDAVADAEAWLEPVDVQPGERGYDAEGRALVVRVVGKVKKGWFGIDQGSARVEIALAEESPTHAEELRGELVRWLTAVDGSAPAGGLVELVERARRHAVR
jgi:hypothetical protein